MWRTSGVWAKPTSFVFVIVDGLCVCTKNSKLKVGWGRERSAPPPPECTRFTARLIHMYCSFLRAANTICMCQTTSPSNSARNLSKTWVCTCNAPLIVKVSTQNTVGCYAAKLHVCPLLILCKNISLKAGKLGGQQKPKTNRTGGMEQE